MGVNGLYLRREKGVEVTGLREGWCDRSERWESVSECERKAVEKISHGDRSKATITDIR